MNILEKNFIQKTSMSLAKKLMYRKNYNAVKLTAPGVTTPMHEEFRVLEKCLCFMDTFSSH